MHWPTAEISRGPMLNFSTLHSKLTGTPSLSTFFDPQCNGSSNCIFQEQVIMKHIPIKRCMKAGLKPNPFYTYNAITLFFNSRFVSQPSLAAGSGSISSAAGASLLPRVPPTASSFSYPRWEGISLSNLSGFMAPTPSRLTPGFLRPCSPS